MGNVYILGCSWLLNVITFTNIGTHFENLWTADLYIGVLGCFWLSTAFTFVIIATNLAFL